MHSTHAPSTAAVARPGPSLEPVLDAVEAVIGRRPDPSDRLEADLALDSIDLARIAAAVPYDLIGRLAGMDFEQLVELTVADLAPDADQPPTAVEPRP